MTQLYAQAVVRDGKPAWRIYAQGRLWALGHVTRERLGFYRWQTRPDPLTHDVSPTPNLAAINLALAFGIKDAVAPEEWP